MPEIETPLNPETTALLVVDVQNDFVHPTGRGGRGGTNMVDLIAAAAEINRLVEAARATSATVVYVRTEHGPDVDTAPYQARYARRGMAPDDTLCHRGTWGAELFTDLTPPVAGELVLVKHGYDAFQQTHLADALRARGVTTVIVTGVVANLCVRATAYSAFEQGFFVLVPRQTTAAVKPEDKARALDDIAAYYGEIVDAGDLIRAWQGAPLSSPTER